MDFSKIEDFDPSAVYAPSEKSVHSLPPKDKAGYRLAIIVLIMMGIIFLWALISYTLEDYRLASLADKYLGEVAKVPDQNAIKELFTQIETERKNLLDAWLRILQLVVLSSLLPVLTALLGYIFGSKEGK